MRGRFLVLTLVVLALAAACGSTTDQATAPGTVGGSTVGTTAGTPLLPLPTSTTDPPGVHRYDTYWMRNCPNAEADASVADCRIGVGEQRTTTSDDVPRDALEQLLAGPDPAETGVGLDTHIRKVAKLNSLKIEDGVATVDFNRYFETAKTRPQAAQVVFVLTQFPEIKQVTITVENMPNGAIGVAPFTRETINEFTPSIFVESPALNASVASRFKVTGSAVATVGTVRYRIEGAGGVKLAEGSAPVLGPSTGRGVVLLPVTLADNVSGAATLVVYQKPAVDGDPELTPQNVPITITTT